MTRLKNIIERFRCRIESAARGTASAPLFSIETVLLVLSVLYGGAMGLRARLYEKGLLSSKTLPCRVVSIGNLIAGGTGKTPMTILIAQIIRDLGYRVVVISRGYHGRMEETGGVVSDGETILKGPDDAGDEPYLMARLLKGIPVVVGRRRHEIGMMAVNRFNPDAIVLDDAFQHIRLNRDLNLVLLDSRSPFGNGHLLPRGLLREPVSALHRAHAVIFTRGDKAVRPSTLDALAADRPVFYTAHVPLIRKNNPVNNAFLTETLEISNLKGKKAVAFAGLADNGQFFDSLQAVGCILLHHFSFSDHYRYGRQDFDRIAETARKKGADVLVTTHKDFVKIEDGYRRWPVALTVVDVTIRLLGDPSPFLDLLSNALDTPDS